MGIAIGTPEQQAEHRKRFAEAWVEQTKHGGKRVFGSLAWALEWRRRERVKRRKNPSARKRKTRRERRWRRRNRR